MSPPGVRVHVSSACTGWARALPEAKRLARTAAHRALARGMAEAGIEIGHAIELGIILADDAQQQRLNRDWRGIDRPTNVLAFAAWEVGAPAPRGAPVLLGDVVIACETVAREAAEQGQSVADHFRHLVVHGVLHLLGYDHDAESAASAMETLETSILASLGAADPYHRAM